jgi:hypothetical protein
MSSKIILALIVLLVGCTSNAGGVQPSKMVSDFYHLSTSEQMRKFENHTLDEQYELYIFGNKVVHPPATYLAEPFARQGAKVVPFLSEKLKAEKDEARIRDIVLVFAEMARLNLYDFSQDTELMSLLNQKINNMQGMWKDVTLKFLSEIQASIH